MITKFQCIYVYISFNLYMYYNYIYRGMQTIIHKLLLQKNIQIYLNTDICKYEEVEVEVSDEVNEIHYISNDNNNNNNSKKLIIKYLVTSDNMKIQFDEAILCTQVI